MRVVSTKSDLISSRAGLAGAVGFVPTMGALHAGHGSLIERSAGENPNTVVSIFVNPMQFAPSEDLDRYPRTLEADLELCRELGATLVFAPDKDLMYPPGFLTSVNVEGLTERLCGASRPDHFRGVTTVVTKLFNLVQPTRAYFGQKDAQQALVLTRMALDLDMPLEVITCPIVREPDGLALSSRNRYLSEDERRRALSLSAALRVVEEAFRQGERDAAALRRLCRTALLGGLGADDSVDYVEVLDAGDLSDIEAITRPALCAVAARVGATRLIDNTVLG